MKKPFYELDESTEKIIVELYKKAQDLNLGNFSFEYYATPMNPGAIFRVTEYNTYWELIVSVESKGIDVYKIHDDGIEYECSEK